MMLKNRLTIQAISPSPTAGTKRQQFMERSYSTSQKLIFSFKIIPSETETNTQSIIK